MYVCFIVAFIFGIILRVLFFSNSVFYEDVLTQQTREKLIVTGKAIRNGVYYTALFYKGINVQVPGFNLYKFAEINVPIPIDVEIQYSEGVEISFKLLPLEEKEYLELGYHQKENDIEKNENVFVEE